jgi:metal-sulfur cluster biosynthetic enzyme
MDNPNPKIFAKSSSRKRDLCFNDDLVEEVDALEIFDLIKNINDPEHPVSLEQLNVVRPEHIYIKDSNNEGYHSDFRLKTILVHFTPTIPHCSMATLIGLSIQMKLIRSLPPSKYRILVQIRPGTHNSEIAINRQLADKERVAAAGENSNLRRVVAACLMGPPRSGIAL